MSVERGVATSAVWSIAIRIVDRGFGFISILILARLLSPADYGLVAMATSIVALLDALTAFGFEWAIIQRQTCERELLDSAWTLNVLIGVSNAALFVALIPAAVAFFHEPRLAEIIVVLAVGLLIGGLRNVGMVLFEQDLKFRRLFVLSIAKKVLGFVTTLTIAVVYRSYWALVVGQLVITITDFVMSYVLSNYRPKPRLSGWRGIMSFSKWMYVSNLINFGNTRATHFIIGNGSGPSALGAYNMAYELANLPTSELIAPAFRALFPGFSKLSSDIPRLRALVVAALSLATLLALPAAAGIAVLADPLAVVVLGRRWAAVGPLVAVLAVFGAASAVFSPLSAVNFAVGRIDVGAKINLCAIIVTLPLFSVLLINFDLVAAAWGLVLGRIAAGATNFLLIMNWLRMPMLPIWRSIWRQITASLVMIFVLRLLKAAYWSSEGAFQISQLVGLISVGALTYIGTVLGLWRMSGSPDSSERQVLRLLGALKRRLAGKLQ